MDIQDDSGGIMTSKLGGRDVRSSGDRRRRATSRRLGAAIAALVLALGGAVTACNDEENDPTGPFCGMGRPCAVTQVDSIVLEAPGDTLLAGEPFLLVVEALDSVGAVIEGVPFTLRSSDTTVATVDAEGNVTPRGPGTATITVRAGRRSAQVTIVVVPKAFSRLDAGADFACGSVPGGRGYCWGLGELQQLASAADSVCFDEGASQPVGCTLLPKRMEAALPVAQVSAGDGFACAVSADARAFCWGTNASGQLGRGSTAPGGPGPATVYGGLPFEFVTAGGRHACALAGTQAYCWGDDALGQLGDAGTINSTTPIPVVGVPAFSTIDAGFGHTCAITPEQAAFCWGDNRLGQLGTGAAGSPSAVPVRVAGTAQFAAISAGDGAHTCALTATGAAFCWGDNRVGQLGLGAAGVPDSVVATPMPVAGGLAFVEISAGRDFTCARTEAGSIYCWGRNSHGQLGNGQSGVMSATPVKVVDTPLIENPAGPPAAPLTFTSVTAGRRHACGLASDGHAYCWGSKIFGALGDELQAAVRGVPVRVALTR
jgi:alpha-tubulin suppressor-like RCC1 family protein